MDMRDLRSAIQEFDRVMARQGDQSYRSKAMEMRNNCQNELKQRMSDMAKANSDWYMKLPKGMLQPAKQGRAVFYCGKCGAVKYGDPESCCPRCGFR